MPGGLFEVTGGMADVAAAAASLLEVARAALELAGVASELEDLVAALDQRARHGAADALGGAEQNRLHRGGSPNSRSLCALRRVPAGSQRRQTR